MNFSLIKGPSLNAGYQKAISIVAAIITLAKSLGLNIIAEGIEDAETLQILNKLGCEMGQGYYFARPMPLADLLKINSDKLP